MRKVEENALMQEVNLQEMRVGNSGVFSLVIY